MKCRCHNAPIKAPLTRKVYSLRQRIVFRIAEMLGVQLYCLWREADGTAHIQPGLFYTGWKYRAAQLLGKLIWS